MRLLVVIFLTIFSLYASDIDDLMIIEAKLYPKITLLDENVKKNNIKIGVLYNQESFEKAKKLQKYLKLNNIDSILIKLEDINTSNVDAYIVTNKQIDEKIIDTLLKKHKLIFSLYPQSINSSMISLDIGVKIKPVLNLRLIKLGKIRLNPIIFKFAEIYNEEK
jgi:hypothetical protein